MSEQAIKKLARTIVAEAREEDGTTKSVKQLKADLKQARRNTHYWKRNYRIKERGANSLKRSLVKLVNSHSEVQQAKLALVISQDATARAEADESVARTRDIEMQTASRISHPHIDMTGYAGMDSIRTP